MAISQSSYRAFSSSLIADNSITSAKIVEGAISTEKFSSAFVEAASASKISNVQYANVTYHPLDDLAANVEGGYAIINGSGFAANPVVKVGGNIVPSVSRVNSSTLRIALPAETVGSKDLELYNSDGSIVVLLNGIAYGDSPAWVSSSSLDNQLNATFFAVSLNASSDSNVTYAVQSGSSLPTGVTLESNGYLSGTVTVEAETTYSFTLEAIDEELQETPKTFSLTVITQVPRVLSISPDYNGASTWNLDEDGPISIDTNTVYTITAQGEFEANVKMWGAGGASWGGGVGGGGAYLGGTLSLSNSDVVGIYVGGGGSGSYSAPTQSGAGGVNNLGVGNGGPGGAIGPYSGGYYSTSPGTPGNSGGGGGGASQRDGYWGGGGGAASKLQLNSTTIATAPGGGGALRNTGAGVPGGAGGTGNGSGGVANTSGGQGGAFDEIPTGWSSASGSGGTAGNDGDADRGTSGNSSTPGKIHIS